MRTALFLSVTLLLTVLFFSLFRFGASRSLAWVGPLLAPPLGGGALLSSEGRVGLGVPLPLDRFHIGGSLRLSDASPVLRSRDFSANTASHLIGIYPSWAVDAVYLAGGNVTNGVGSSRLLFFGRLKSVGVDLQSGGVGIGTLPSSSLPLSVASGDIQVTGGLIFRDIDGSGCHRVSLSSLGVLSSSVVACP